MKPISNLKHKEQLKHETTKKRSENKSYKIGQGKDKFNYSSIINITTKAVSMENCLTISCELTSLAGSKGLPSKKRCIHFINLNLSAAYSMIKLPLSQKLILIVICQAACLSLLMTLICRYLSFN